MMLSDNYKIAAAILMGLVFGFLLIKTDLAWRKSLVEIFLLRNGRLLKTILLMVAAGSMFCFFARQNGMTALQVRPAYFWASLAGGVICGTGLAMACFTPVTALTSLAAGRINAVWALLGMVLALPAIHGIKRFLDRSVLQWETPLSAPSEYASFLQWDNPALWVTILSLGLLVIVQFTVGDPEE